jgi:ribose transport system ATP-binding protein
VEIARALSTKPKVLFLDEPTEPFQQADIRKLFDLIRSLRQQGVAIVYVSHRLHEVTELSDRITVIRDGEMVDTRPTRDFTMADIVTRIAGRPLAQMFPAKSGKVGDPLLEVEAMSGTGFDAVSLTVRAGEIVGLAGVEGEGQREFLRAVAGIDRRAHGSVKVAGKTVRGESPQAARAAGMGFVTDDRHAEGLFLGLSVRENLALGFLGKIAAGGIIDRAKEIKTGSGISEQLRVRTASLEAPVSSLSGGNQQKVLFGREIAAEPKVLLVDEPTSGVDVGARTEIYQRLRSLADQGLAVLVSSSDGVELEGLCDRVFIFARGKIVRELTGAEVTDTTITEANLTATVSRSATVRRRDNAGLGKLLAGDHFPAIVLTVITAIIVIVTQAASQYFLTGFNIHQMLTLLSILCFVSMGQLLTILVGGIDLSLGPLVGFCVVLASYLVPEDGPLIELIGGSVVVVLFCIVFGFLQGQLVTWLRLPSVVVTLASFMGLQGLSLLLRPHPKGSIDDVLSDTFRFSVVDIPLAIILVLIAVGGLEWLLYRSDIGRRLRAVGSNPVASHRLGVNSRTITLLAFTAAGGLAGIAGLMQAAQIGIGSGTTGVDYTLLSVTAVVLGGASVAGGRGSFLATLFGCALVQATTSASSFLKADTSVQFTVVGAVTLIAAGLFSLARRHRAGSGAH